MLFTKLAGMNTFNNQPSSRRYLVQMGGGIGDFFGMSSNKSLFNVIV